MASGAIPRHSTIPTNTHDANQTRGAPRDTHAQATCHLFRVVLCFTSSYGNKTVEFSKRNRHIYKIVKQQGFFFKHSNAVDGVLLVDLRLPKKTYAMNQSEVKRDARKADEEDKWTLLGRSGKG